MSIGNFPRVCMISLLLSGYGQAEEEKSAERQASVERGQALVVALSKQDYKQTDRLLEAGADPNSRDEEGGTPLLYAARHGEAEWVGRLLEVGADPNVRKQDGVTPLMSAAHGGHVKAVVLLINAGADPNARDDKNGWTPLIHAANGGASTLYSEPPPEYSGDGLEAFLTRYLNVVSLLIAAGGGE